MSTPPIPPPPMAPAYVMAPAYAKFLKDLENDPYAPYYGTVTEFPSAAGNQLRAHDVPRPPATSWFGYRMDFWDVPDETAEPDKAAEETTERNAEDMLEKSAQGTPGMAVEETAERIVEKKTDMNNEKAQEQFAQEVPAIGVQDTTERTMEEITEMIAEEAPEAQEKVVEEDPEMASDQTTERITDVTPEQAEQETSGTAAEKAPEVTQTMRPEAPIFVSDLVKMTEELVDALMDVPKNIRNSGRPDNVRVTILWAMKKLGEGHFRRDGRTGVHRSVLTTNSTVRLYGIQAGLPSGYWHFLCGPPAGATVEEGYHVRTDFQIVENRFVKTPEHLRPVGPK